MGVFRLSRRARARIGWWLGWLLVVVGLLLVCVAAALVVAGLVVALTFLLLYDVDEEANDGQPASVRSPW